jgi:hypothetical protein
MFSRCRKHTVGQLPWLGDSPKYLLRPLSSSAMVRGATLRSDLWCPEWPGPSANLVTSGTEYLHLRPDDPSDAQLTRTHRDDTLHLARGDDQRHRISPGHWRRRETTSGLLAERLGHVMNPLLATASGLCDGQGIRGAAGTDSWWPTIIHFSDREAPLSCGHWP